MINFVSNAFSVVSEPEGHVMAHSELNMAESHIMKT